MTSEMIPAQVARVLAMVAVAEQRQVDEADVSFWLNTLAVNGVTEEEFRNAVVRHYSESTYPIKPGHVWRIVQAGRGLAQTDAQIAQTYERMAQRAMLDQALTTGDWAKFEAHWPGVRHAEIKRNIEWWLELRAVDPATVIPPDVIEQARLLDISTDPA